MGAIQKVMKLLPLVPQAADLDQEVHGVALCARENNCVAQLRSSLDVKISTRGDLVKVASSIRQATNLKIDENSEICQGIVASQQPVLQLVMDACESDGSCPATLQPAMDYIEELKKTPGGEADDHASCIMMTASAMLQ